MKRAVLLSFVMVGIIMSGFNGVAVAQQKPIELSFNLMMQPTHLRYVGAIKPWIDELEKRAQGRVKIVPYFSATLSPLNENYESAVTGVADIAEAFVGLTPGRFPVSEIMNLADIRPTCTNTSRVIWDIYKKFPEARKEFSDTHIIAIYCTGWQFLFTGKKPVRTMEDIKGLKVMSPAKAISETVKVGLYSNAYFISPGRTELKIRIGAFIPALRKATASSTQATPRYEAPSFTRRRATRTIP